MKRAYVVFKPDPHTRNQWTPVRIYSIRQEAFQHAIELAKLPEVPRGTRKRWIESLGVFGWYFLGEWRSVAVIPLESR